MYIYMYIKMKQIIFVVCIKVTMKFESILKSIYVLTLPPPPCGEILLIMERKNNADQ